jgi:hypothetical protein
MRHEAEFHTLAINRTLPRDPGVPDRAEVHLGEYRDDLYRRPGRDPPRGAHAVVRLRLICDTVAPLDARHWLTWPLADRGLQRASRYRDSGIEGLADRSHAPKSHPWRISAERLDGPVAHILTGGILARTIACPSCQKPGPGCGGRAPEQPSRHSCPNHW